MERKPDMKSSWRSFESSHAKLFNFMVRRVTAAAFLLGGTVVAGFGIPNVLPGGTLLVNGVPSHDLVMRWSSVLFPALVALFGFLLYRSKPYVPRKRRDESI